MKAKLWLILLLFLVSVAAVHADDEDENKKSDPTKPQNNFTRITSTIEPGTSEAVNCPLFSGFEGGDDTLPPVCARLSGEVRNKVDCGVNTPDGVAYGNMDVIIVRSSGTFTNSLLIARGKVDAQCHFDFLVSTRFANANANNAGVYWFGLITLTPPSGGSDPNWSTCTNSACPGV